MACNELLARDVPHFGQPHSFSNGIDLDQVRQAATGVGFGRSGNTVARPTGRTISTKRLSV